MAFHFIIFHILVGNTDTESYGHGYTNKYTNTNSYGDGYNHKYTDTHPNSYGYIWSLNLGALRTADGKAYLDITDETLAIEVITPSDKKGSRSIAIDNLTLAPTLVLEDYRIYLPVITR